MKGNACPKNAPRTHLLSFPFHVRVDGRRRTATSAGPASAQVAAGCARGRVVRSAPASRCAPCTPTEAVGSATEMERAPTSKGKAGSHASYWLRPSTRARVFENSPCVSSAAGFVHHLVPFPVLWHPSAAAARPMQPEPQAPLPPQNTMEHKGGIRSVLKRAECVGCHCAWVAQGQRCPVTPESKAGEPATP